MIDALRNDDLINKLGGRFKLTALVQRRWLELLQGARPLVDPTGMTDIEIVLEEILQDKIGIDFEASGLLKPDGR
ncbi:MAG: DNA-directed RNA polymerase subunit omega [Planctomycetes bacterium]|nr:DNA-directed RNA polymerase subunit omega [Planctomycetota bacterium]